MQILMRFIKQELFLFLFVFVFVFCFFVIKETNCRCFNHFKIVNRISCQSTLNRDNSPVTMQCCDFTNYNKM